MVAWYFPGWVSSIFFSPSFILSHQHLPPYDFLEHPPLPYFIWKNVLYCQINHCSTGVLENSRKSLFVSGQKTLRKISPHYPPGNGRKLQMTVQNRNGSFRRHSDSITVKWHIWWEEARNLKVLEEWKSGFRSILNNWKCRGLHRGALGKPPAHWWWRDQGTRLNHSGKHLLFPPDTLKKWGLRHPERHPAMAGRGVQTLGQALGLNPQLCH